MRMTGSKRVAVIIRRLGCCTRVSAGLALPKIVSEKALRLSYAGRFFEQEALELRGLTWYTFLAVVPSGWSSKSNWRCCGQLMADDLGNCIANDVLESQPSCPLVSSDE